MLALLSFSMFEFSVFGRKSIDILSVRHDFEIVRILPLMTITRKHRNGLKRLKNIILKDLKIENGQKITIITIIIVIDIIIIIDYDDDF